MGPVPREKSGEIAAYSPGLRLFSITPVLPPLTWIIICSGLLALLVPTPCIFEGADLAGGFGAVFFMEEGVVALGRIEGWIEVHQVHRLVLQIAAHDVEVVAVIERAHARMVTPLPGKSIMHSPGATRRASMRLAAARSSK